MDSGDHCVAAFEKAIATFPKDSTLYHLVHVRPEKDELFLAPLSPDFKRLSREMEQLKERESHEVLQKFARLADAAGIRHMEVELRARPHWMAKHGDTREKLCHYCGDVGATVLVMGCRGVGPVERMLHKSVSAFCKQHACCPVLTDADPMEPKVVEVTPRPVAA